MSLKGIIHALIQVFTKIGFPKEIQCDLGTSFTSELTITFSWKYDIKVNYFSICNSQNNVVERIHSTLKRILKVLCLKSEGNWEESLPMALFVFRMIWHESTSFSPSEINFCQKFENAANNVFFIYWMQEVVVLEI